MNTKVMIAVALGAVVGYYFASTLATYPGFSTLDNALNPAQG